MRAERAAGVLEVNALWMEPGRRLTPARARRLEAELDRIRRFVGLDAVRFADGYLKRDVLNGIPAQRSSLGAGAVRVACRPERRMSKAPPRSSEEVL